jgi:8-oxo-dGTP pyrophosphatase MutT (NUDIX family)
MDAKFEKLTGQTPSLQAEKSQFADVPLLADPRFEYQDRYASMEQRARSYAIILRVNDSGEVEILLKKRGCDRTFPGYFDLPGGEVGNNTNPIGAVTEIVREQLGIRLTDVKIYGQALWQDAAGKENTADCAQAFRATVIGDNLIPDANRNVEGFEWVTRQRLTEIQVINLDSNLDPTKSGRMGLMILAGLATAREEKA